MTETVISREDLAALLEYSCSIPTGTTIGVRWRRDMSRFIPLKSEPLPCLPLLKTPVEWVIGEYVADPDPERVGIKWSWAVDENHNVHRGEL